MRGLELKANRAAHEYLRLSFYRSRSHRPSTRRCKSLITQNVSLYSDNSGLADGDCGTAECELVDRMAPPRVDSRRSHAERGLVGQVHQALAQDHENPVFSLFESAGLLAWIAGGPANGMLGGDATAKAVDVRETGRFLCLLVKD